MPDGSTGICRDCAAPIKWQSRNGRWVPLDPYTGDRHRCSIEKTCEGPGCGKTFKGAPWMKHCPECYKIHGSGRSRPQEPASKPRKREPLKPGGSDDVPF